MTYFILFLISFMGINLAVFNYSRLKLIMAPFISVSIISSVMMIAGLLNILEPTVGIIQILGVLFALYYGYQFYRQKNFKQFFQKEFNFGILLYILGVLYFLFLLSNQELVHYDNFSHWGTVVKEIFLNNALPTEWTHISDFTNYPPGTAVFIYYFMKATFPSEGMALFGQYLIISSSILTIFSIGNRFSSEVRDKYSKIRNIAINLMLTLLSIYLLVGVRRVQDLLVDTVLVVVGIALLLTIVEMFREKAVNPFILTAILFFLTLVKNIGILFAVIALIIYILLLVINKRHKQIKNWLPVLAPVVANRLWAAHVALVFPVTEVSKHDMSVENYAATFSEKTRLDIQMIAENFFEKVSNYNFVPLILLSVILLAIIFIGKAYQAKTLFLGLIFFMSLLVIYIFGLLAMYIFSMPINEALGVAAFGRYMNTFVIYLVGIISLMILHGIQGYDIKKQLVFIGLFILTFGVNNLMADKLGIVQTFTIREQDSKVTNLESAFPDLTDNKILSSLPDETYLIYEPENGASSFQNYYMKYRFNSDNVIIVDSTESLKAQYKDADYILIPDSGLDVELDDLNITRVQDRKYKVN